MPIVVSNIDQTRLFDTLASIELRYRFWLLIGLWIFLFLGMAILLFLCYRIYYCRYRSLNNWIDNLASLLETPDSGSM